MLREALSRSVSTARELDAGWLDAAADRVLSAMEERRSTWQIWHVRAEAQRFIRAGDVPTTEANRLVDLLVDEVLNRRSISLARPDGIAEPQVLQRSDGASVYTVAGAELFTSRRILDAEQRLVVAAGRRDGHTMPTTAVEVALLEATAHGVALNAGQAAVVYDMATSGARLQLAIAPRRHRQNNRAAGPGRSLAARRRHRHQARPLRRRSCRAARSNQHPHRNTRQTQHLTATPPPATRLGDQHLAIDAHADRRSRHGRHPLP
jgi:hypothetical protein